MDQHTGPAMAASPLTMFLTHVSWDPPAMVRQSAGALMDTSGTEPREAAPAA